MLNDFFSGIGFVVLFLIALAIAVIVVGFKILLWVVGITLALVLITSFWYWLCRMIAKMLPEGTKAQQWFKKRGEIEENKQSKSGDF